MSNFVAAGGFGGSSSGRGVSSVHSSDHALSFKDVEENVTNAVHGLHTIVKGVKNEVLQAAPLMKELSVLHTEFSDNVEKESKAFLTTAQVSAQRSTFVAAFAYKQLLSYGAAPNKDLAYLICNCLAFVSGIMAAAISLYIAHFMDNWCEPESKLEFIKLSNKYARANFRFFIVAILAYCLGLSRLGYVYFDQSDGKFIPTIIFLSTFIIVLVVLAYCYFVAFMNQIHKKNDGISDENKRRAGGGGSLSSHDPLTSSSSSSSDNDTSSSLKDTDKSGASNDFAEELSARCFRFAERSIFIAGMVQGGISQSNFTDFSGFAGRMTLLYTIAITLSTSLAILVTASLSSMGIFLNGVSDSIKLEVAEKYVPLFQYSYYVFYASLIFQIFSIILMPFGANYNAKDGSDFSPVINSSLGFSFLVILALSLFWIQFCFGRVQAADTSLLSTASSLGGFDSDIDEKSLKDKVAATLSSFSNIGSQATLACSFSFGAIIKFGSIDNSSSQIISPNLYLISNLAVVIFGIIVAVTDMAINYYMSYFRNSVRSQFLFLLYLRGTIVSNNLFFYFSAISRYLVFSLYGVIAFHTITYIPLIYSVLGAGFIFAVYVFVDNEIHWIDNITTISTTYSSNTTSNSSSNSSSSTGSNILPANLIRQSSSISSQQQIDEELVSRSKTLKGQASQILFLGSISMGSISLYSWNDEYKNCFLNFLSASFVASLISIYFSTLYDNMITTFKGGNKNASLFITSTRVHYLIPALMSSLVVILLVLGFFTLSLHDKDYGSAIITIIALSCIALLSIFVWDEFQSVNKGSESYLDKVVRREGAEPSSADPKESQSISSSSSSSYKNILDQAAAAAVVSAFVGSNIFWETLSLDNIDNTVAPILRVLYKILISYSIGSALMIVSINIIISYFFNELDSSSKKNSLYNKIKILKTGVIFLAGSSLFAWICSSIFIPFVKYKSSFVDRSLSLPGTVICTLGTIFYLYSSYDLKSISDHCQIDTVLAKQSSTRTEDSDPNTNTTSTKDQVGGLELKPLPM